MKEIISEGKTREDALAQALHKLGVDASQVEVEEMESQQRDRFFGLLSTRIIKLKVSVIEQQPKPPAPGEPELEDEDFDEDLDPDMDYDDEYDVADVADAGQAPPREKRVSTPEQDQAVAATVSDFLSGVLQKMGVDLEVNTEINDGVVTVSLEGEDSGMIIGKFGQTLDSLQYLTNVVISKQAAEKTKVVIQVGDYRRRREASLRRMAKAMAYKVLKSKKKVVLAPMPPQDRRIIHLALANFRHISTGSEGVGPDRRVVISYKS